MNPKSLNELSDSEAIKELIAELRQMDNIAPDNIKQIITKLIAGLESGDPLIWRPILEAHRRIEKIETENATREIRGWKPKVN